MKRWTDAKLAAEKPGATRKQRALGRGLYFIVEPWGAKYWRYRYKIAGTETRMKLGPYPAIGLADAERLRNEKEREARVARAGEGPAPAVRAKVARAERLAAPTVAGLADVWLKRKRNKQGKPLAPKTVLERRKLLDKDILPHIGVMKAGHITKNHCREIINEVIDRGAMGQAVQVHKALRALFLYAVAEGYIEASPMAGRPAPAPYIAKERALSEVEVRALFAALETSDVSCTVRQCIEWQLMTAARPSEARLATWAEINEKTGTWTIPAERSKNRKPHIVYLSDALRSVLDAARATRGDGKHAALFPGRSEGKPLSDLAVTRALKRLHTTMQSKLRELTGDADAVLADFTQHDLRRTAATLVTNLGHSRFIAGLLLNHTDQSVTAIYDRNNYEAEKRQAWRALGERVASLKGAVAAHIIPLAAHKAA